MKIEKRFHELMSFAASEAAFAFSELLNQQMALTTSTDVNVRVCEVQSINESISEEVAQINPDLGNALIMTTPLLGTLEGIGSYIVPETSALRLCDVLLQRKFGATRKFGNLEESAILETGNIIVSCFLNALGFVSIFDNIMHKKMTLIKGEIPSLNHKNTKGKFLVRISFYMNHSVEDEHQCMDIDGIGVFFFDSAKITALLNTPHNPEKSC
jgi:hypothetical protein